MSGKATWSWSKLMDRGRKAVMKGKEDEALLSARLQPATLSGLERDMEAAMGKDVVGTAQKARSALLAATKTEAAARAEAHAWVSAIREALVRSKAPKGVLKTAGVGAGVPKASTPKVLTAADQILDAAEKHPEVFRSAGVLPEDLTKLSALREGLQARDAAQGVAKLSGKERRLAKAALAYRIQRAAEEIAMAGILQFADDAVKAAPYRLLVGPSSRPKPKKKAPSA